MCGQMEECRMRIDEIDDELLRLLNERSKLVAELGIIKKTQGMPLLDRIREDYVLTRVREKNCGPLDEEGALKIFELIISESRRIEAGLLRYTS